jgi:hypothetical protein
MEALQRLHNRGSISTGYDIENSVKFEPDNSEYLHKTPTSSGNRRTFTISMWIKRTELGIDSYLMQSGDGDYNQSDRTLIKFDSTDNFRFGGGSAYQRTTNRVFRDTSAWYHIVMAVDTTDSTAANRLKLYVNGVQETSFSTSADPSQNFQYAFCKDDKHSVGFNHTDNVSYFAGYMSEVILIDGQQLDPTSFGKFDEDTGIWKPIDVSGLSFGTNGFYLDFKDSSNLGNDASGGTDFTLNNITSGNAAVDSPTNNFAILSPAMQGYYEDQWSIISDGGTKFRCTEFDVWITTVSSIGVTKGKWYAEFQPTGARPNNMFGIASMEQLDNNSGYIYGGHLGKANESWGIGYYQTNGRLYKVQNSGSSNILNFGSGISQNQKVGVAIDMDNHNLYISISNTWQNSGDPTSGATGTGAISFDDTETVAFGLSGYSLGSGNDTIVSVNFGGYRTGGLPSINSTDENGYGVFRYAPPSGYYALCTKNLEEFG